MIVRNLFDCPRGTWFRYLDGETSKLFVLLDRAGTGLVADTPEHPEHPDSARQGMYSAAETPQAFRALEVEVVKVAPVLKPEAPKPAPEAPPAGTQHNITWVKDGDSRKYYCTRRDAMDFHTDDEYRVVKTLPYRVALCRSGDSYGLWTAIWPNQSQPDYFERWLTDWTEVVL